MTTTLAASAATIEPKPIGEHTGSLAPNAPDTIPWRTTLAEDACFFAIITPDALGQSDATTTSRRLLRSLVTSRSAALDEALQRWLPIPVDQVHSAYVLIDHVTTPLIVACAAPIDVVTQWRAAGILSAGPQSLPDCVNEALTHAGLPPRTIAASDFEFMTGPFAPPTLARASRRMRAAAFVGVLVTTGLVALGLSRRAAYHDDLAASVAASTQQVHQRALGIAHADAERNRLTMATEISRLRTAAAGVREPNPPIDAAAITSDILARWPRECPTLFARLQGVNITPVGITLSVLLAADADPEPVLAGLRSLPGWQLQPAQRSGAPAAPNGQAEARLTLRLIRAPAPP